MNTISTHLLNRTASKRKERYKNSGSLMPNAIQTMYALEKVFRGLREPRLIVTWLYWWLTNELMNSSSFDHVFMPPCRVRSNAECEANRTRIYYDGSTSWVEFSMPYFDSKRNQIQWVWQPCPRSLNSLFHSVVSNAPLHQFGEPPISIINDEELSTVIYFIQRKQRRNPNLRLSPTVRKDNLHRYPSVALRSHPTLDSVTKYLCSRHLHHDSAHYYLSRNISQIRSALYHAHNHILERLWQAAHDQQCLSRFKILSTTNQDKSIKLSIESLTRCHEAHYLKDDTRAIHRYYRDANTGEIHFIPDVELAHSRTLTLAQVQALFADLHHYLSQQRPLKTDALEHHVHYYNEVTCVLALQLIVLTSARPTHAIFPHRQHVSRHLTLIRDKGKQRQLYLNDFIWKELERYLDLQTTLLHQLGVPLKTRPEPLGFFLSSSGEIKTLQASSLRVFLKRVGQPFIPYQLRHYHAQFGITNLQPSLSTALLDHIMGHSQHGEGLLQTSLFPAHYLRIQRHLNRLTQVLNLKEFPL